MAPERGAPTTPRTAEAAAARTDTASREVSRGLGAALAAGPLTPGTALAAGLLTPGTALAMQRSVGNAAVARVAERSAPVSSRAPVMVHRDHHTPEAAPDTAPELHRPSNQLEWDLFSRSRGRWSGNGKVKFNRTGEGAGVVTGRTGGHDWSLMETKISNFRHQGGRRFSGQLGTTLAGVSLDSGPMPGFPLLTYEFKAEAFDAAYDAAKSEVELDVLKLQFSVKGKAPELVGWIPGLEGIDQTGVDVEVSANVAVSLLPSDLRRLKRTWRASREVARAAEEAAEARRNLSRADRRLARQEQAFRRAERKLQAARRRRGGRAPRRLQQALARARTARAAARLEAQAARREARRTTRALKAARNRLTRATRAMARGGSKVLQRAAVRGVTRAMGRVLLKVIPIVGWIATAYDIIDIVSKLLNGAELGLGGGDGDGPGVEGGVEDGTSQTGGTEPIDGGGEGAEGGGGGEGGTGDSGGGGEAGTGSGGGGGGDHSGTGDGGSGPEHAPAATGGQDGTSDTADGSGGGAGGDAGPDAATSTRDAGADADAGGGTASEPGTSDAGSETGEPGRGTMGGDAGATASAIDGGGEDGGADGGGSQLPEAAGPTQVVLRVLRASSGGVPLGPNEIERLNQQLPADLTMEEAARLAEAVAQGGVTTPEQLVDRVLSRIRTLREGGEPASGEGDHDGGAGTDDADDRTSDQGAETSPDGAGGTGTGGGAGDGSRVGDVEGGIDGEGEVTSEGATDGTGTGAGTGGPLQGETPDGVSGDGPSGGSTSDVADQEGTDRTGADQGGGVGADGTTDGGATGAGEVGTEGGVAIDDQARDQEAATPEETTDGATQGGESQAASDSALIRNPWPLVHFDMESRRATPREAALAGIREGRARGVRPDGTPFVLTDVTITDQQERTFAGDEHPYVMFTVMVHARSVVPEGETPAMLEPQVFRLWVQPEVEKFGTAGGAMQARAALEAAVELAPGGLRLRAGIRGTQLNLGMCSATVLELVDVKPLSDGFGGTMVLQTTAVHDPSGSFTTADGIVRPTVGEQMRLPVALERS